MKTRSALVALALLAAVPMVLTSHNFASAAKPKTAPRAAAERSAERSSALAYHDTWRKLWQDHITWTRVVIISLLKDLPCTTNYEGRLLQNYEDMEDALKPYYGDDAETLGDLIKDHLTIAVELLTAAKAGDTTAFNDANARWYTNAQEIAEFQAQLNPEFWPLSEGEVMWEDHLDATLAEAVAVLTDDCAGDVTAYDHVVDLSLPMADFFSDGVIRQFPTQFSGRNCVTHR